MATADRKEVVHELEDKLRVLDELIHQYFPLGGHANVEKAQQLVNEARKALKGLA